MTEIRGDPRDGHVLASPAIGTSRGVGEMGPERSVSRLTYRGQGGSLFGIHLGNLFLTLVTAGLYYFWAKVRVRSYLLGQTEFEGDRFAYHGTGKELLSGFLRALLIFGVPYMALQYAPGFLDWGLAGRMVSGLLAGVVILVFIAVAQVSARRYRLSRSSWRGIRFSFRGPTLEYVKLYLRGIMLNSVTLGAYYPFFQTRRQAFLTTHTYFGDRPFRFDGQGWELAKQFFLPYLLLPLTLGLSWLWFSARKQRFFWNHTAVGGARFQCTITGGSLFALKLVNFFLLLGTLGFAWPWVVGRNARFLFDHLTLEGPLDLEQVIQEAKAASATGEGLSDLLDAGFDFG